MIYGQNREDYPWWPAKVIRKIPNKQKYLVSFFADANNAQQNDNNNYVYIYIYIYQTQSPYLNENKQ